MALIGATVVVAAVAVVLVSRDDAAEGPAKTAAPGDVVEPVANGADRDRFFGIAPQTSLEIEDYRRMGTGGAGTLRVPFIWQAVQPNPGECKAEPKVGVCTWAPFDNLVGYAAAHGMQVLPTLAGRPPFVDDPEVTGTERTVEESHPPTRGPGLEMWRDFLTAAAKRYGPGGHYWDEFTASYDADPIPVTDWQIWNEQNAAAYWEPEPDAEEYAGLIRSSAEALREGDPNARVVLGGMFGTATVRITRYLKDLYAVDGVEDYFDAIAIHPYSPGLRGIKTQVKWVRDVAKAAGDPDVGIWVTELGWGSAESGHRLAVGERGQAQMLRRSFELLLSRRDRWNIEGTIWFTWKDASKGVCRFCRYAGLVDADGDKKRAWEVFRQFVRNRAE